MSSGIRALLIVLLVVAAFLVGYFAHRPLPSPGGGNKGVYVAYSACPAQLNKQHKPHPMGGKCAWSDQSDPSICDLLLTEIDNEQPGKPGADAHDADPACLVHVSVGKNAHVRIINDRDNNPFSMSFNKDPNAPADCPDSIFKADTSQYDGNLKKQVLDTKRPDPNAAGCIYHMVETRAGQPVGGDPHIAGDQ